METRDFDLTDPDAAAFCPACGAGYTSQVRECADCGVALVPKSQVENELRRDHDQEASFAVSDPDLPALCPSCGTELAYRREHLVGEIIEDSGILKERLEAKNREAAVVENGNSDRSGSGA